MHTCRRRAPTYRALVGGDHLDRPRAASADDVRQRRYGLVVDHLRERAGRAPAAGHGSERPSSRSSRRDRYHGARSTTAPPGRGSDAPWLLLVERDNANSGEPRARNPSQSISDGGSAAGRRSGELRCDTRHRSVPLSSRAYFRDRGSERPGSTPNRRLPWRRPRRVPTVVRRRGGRQVPCACRSGVGQEHRRRPQRHEHDQKGQLEVGGGV